MQYVDKDISESKGKSSKTNLEKHNCRKRRVLVFHNPPPPTSVHRISGSVCEKKVNVDEEIDGG